MRGVGKTSKTKILGGEYLVLKSNHKINEEIHNKHNAQETNIPNRQI